MTERPMTRSPVVLRPATPADAPALADLGRTSFCAAFGHLYRPADLATFLEQVYSERVVASEVADPTVTHRLAVASDHTQLTGFCKLRYPSRYAKHSDATNPLALGQLYCHPEHTGEGIGAALMDWALAEANARGCDAVQLSVWAGNEGAQRFYARYGFVHIADIDFMVGDHRDDELLYELRLRPSATPSPA